MTRKIQLLLVLLASPALGGCAVQAALAAAQLAEYLPERQGASNAHLTTAATQACTARAQQYGSVYIVGVDQHRTDKIIVSGSVTDPQQRRRTFECHFTTKVTQFKLREI
jgi:hypothetical protein